MKVWLTEAEELSRATGGDRVERPAQGVVVELRGCHPVALEPVDHDIREKTLIQVETLLHEAETTKYCNWRCKSAHFRRAKSAHLLTFKHALEGSGNAE
ncbi:MAG: hypothetical protein XE11_2284, partial [Methanomicrobiales archaeon 53_19]